jgi:hypothetical protein
VAVEWAAWVVLVNSAVWVAHKSTCRLWMSTSNEIGTVSRSAMRCGTLKVQLLDRLSKRLDDLRVLPYISLHILVVAHPGGVQSTILRRDLSSIPFKHALPGSLLPWRTHISSLHQNILAVSRTAMLISSTKHLLLYRSMDVLATISIMACSEI